MDKIEIAIPLEDYKIKILTSSGISGIFDVKPYLSFGIFQELKDKSLFNSVQPFLGSIQWKNGQDFCPDTLYLESVPILPSGISIA